MKKQKNFKTEMMVNAFCFSYANFSKSNKTERYSEAAKCCNRLISDFDSLLKDALEHGLTDLFMRYMQKEHSVYTELLETIDIFNSMCSLEILPTELVVKYLCKTMKSNISNSKRIEIIKTLLKRGVIQILKKGNYDGRFVSVIGMFKSMREFKLKGYMSNENLEEVKETLMKLIFCRLARSPMKRRIKST